MTVAIVSTYDISGGAARGAYRLHRGLRQMGVDSRMMVMRKDSDDDSVTQIGGKWPMIVSLIHSGLDRLPIRLYRNRQRVPWSLGWLRNGTRRRLLSWRPQLVHLQWIGEGFVPVKALTRLNCPVIWTLRDAWAFTGGCHYPHDCTRYSNSCGSCPQLSSKRENDVSHWVWKAKRKHWENVELTVVAPSRWLAECAQSSSLFSNRRVEVIPHGIDTKVFRPLNKTFAREALNLDQRKKIILTGAFNVTNDLRKGFDLLRESLKQLASGTIRKDSAELVIFGAPQSIDLPDVEFPVRSLGRLHDDVSLGLCYSASDVFVAPSRQEAFGHTILEALACGTPCVAFAGTGGSDIVQHERTGYLAQHLDVEDLAHGISWVLRDDDRREALSNQARERVENEFRLDQMAYRYRELYREILEGRK